MAEFSDRYALPLLQVGQAQKEVTHNEAVAAVDALLYVAVETGAQVAPPVAPVVGQAWIVGPNATGIWVGRDATIAAYGSAGWLYVVPRQGMTAWLIDAQRFAVFTSSGWRNDAWPVAALRIGTRTALAVAPATAPAPVGGATVDAEVRTALAMLVAGLRAQGLAL